MRWAEDVLPADRCLEEGDVGCRSFCSDALADCRNNGRGTCVRRFLKLTHRSPYCSPYVGFGESDLLCSVLPQPAPKLQKSISPFSVSLVALFCQFWQPSIFLLTFSWEWSLKRDSRVLLPESDREGFCFVKCLCLHVSTGAVRGPKRE